MIKKLICWWKGHDWEEVGEYPGILGGFIVKCLRCQKEGFESYQARRWKQVTIKVVKQASFFSGDRWKL